MSYFKIPDYFELLNQREDAKSLNIFKFISDLYLCLSVHLI